MPFNVNFETALHSQIAAACDDIAVVNPMPRPPLEPWPTFEPTSDLQQ